MSRSSTGWTVGFVVVFVAHGVAFAFAQGGASSPVVDLLPWCAPAVAAFVSAYGGSRKRILLGLSMALPSALFVVAINYAWEAQGHAVDFGGLRGNWTLLKITLWWDLLVCLAAAALARVFTRARHTELSEGGRL